MWWYFNVSCTTSYVSSIWMIHSTGHYSMSYLFDWSILIWEHGSIYVAVHGGACSVNCMLAVWIHPLLNMKWSLRKQNVWNDYYDYWIWWLSWKQNVWNDYYDDRVSFEIMVTFICFPEKSIWYCPKLRTEFWYWNASVVGFTFK